MTRRIKLTDLDVSVSRAARRLIDGFHSRGWRDMVHAAFEMAERLEQSKLGITPNGLAKSVPAYILYRNEITRKAVADEIESIVDRKRRW